MPEDYEGERIYLKALRVIGSCKTLKHCQVAEKFLKLALRKLTNSYFHEYLKYSGYIYFNRILTLIEEKQNDNT